MGTTMHRFWLTIRCLMLHYVARVFCRIFVNKMGGARRIHAHFKLRGDSKGLNLSQPCIVLTPFLLVARRKFESASAP